MTSDLPNTTPLRRFAIGIRKSNVDDTVAATIQRLTHNVCLVFDYPRVTDTARTRRLTFPAPVG